MERLIGVLTDQVRVLSERSRVNLVDVQGVGQPHVFQNDASKFFESVKKFEYDLIGIEPHHASMLTWALDTRPKSDRA